MEEFGNRLQSSAVSRKIQFIERIHARGFLVEPVDAHLEFFRQPLDQTRLGKLLLKFLGSRRLPVVLDRHALRIVDDHGEVAVLRQYRRDVHDRTEEYEEKYRKR